MKDRNNSDAGHFDNNCTRIYKELQGVRQKLPSVDDFERRRKDAVLIVRYRTQLVFLFELKHDLDELFQIEKTRLSFKVLFRRNAVGLHSETANDLIVFSEEEKPLSGDWEISSLDTGDRKLPTYQDSGSLEQGVCETGLLLPNKYLLWVER